MNRQFVVTVTGPDLPDMEQDLTRVIASHHGRWVSSRTAHMAGRFASILSVSLSVGEVEGMVQHLNQLADNDLQIRVDQVTSSGDACKERHLLLNLIADDEPELVTDVSRLLTDQHIRISQLHTETLPVPYGGGHLQSIQAHLRAPSGVSVEKVRGCIEALSPELMLDLSLE